MSTMKMLLRMCITVAVIAVTCINIVSSCSCMLAHPQEQACTSDFVIVARVKKFFDKEAVYKVRVKRELKITEKASVALKSGRIVTSPSQSTCGVNLKLDETYVLAGRVVAGQARINLCSYVRPWNEVTARQRKGFRLLYKLGCSCDIIDCPWYRNCPKNDTSMCTWETSRNSDVTLPDCQSENSICMKHANGHCGWTQDRQYKECMKTRRRLRDEQLAREP